MERLTKLCKDTENGKFSTHVVGNYIGIYSDIDFGKVVEKLAEYEDAEEQGLLYRKIFFIGNYCHKPSDCPLICEYCSDNYLEVKDMVVEINRIHIYGEIGKTVFLTEEEAEQALKKMEKNNNE